jgi:hypothetical protein
MARGPCCQDRAGEQSAAIGPIALANGFHFSRRLDDAGALTAARQSCPEMLAEILAGASAELPAETMTADRTIASARERLRAAA